MAHMTDPDFRPHYVPEPPVPSEGLLAVQHARDTLFWYVTTCGQPKVDWPKFRSVMIEDFECDASALDAMASLGDIVHFSDARLFLDLPPVGWAA